MSSRKPATISKRYIKPTYKTKQPESQEIVTPEAESQPAPDTETAVDVPGVPNVPETVEPAQTNIVYNGQVQNFNDFLQANRTEGSVSMSNRLVFAQDSVLQLTGNDFDLKTPSKITINIPDCMMILFYIQNTESINLAAIWGRVASEIAGPVFGAINMLSNRDVARAFADVKSIPNHPYRAFGLQTYPFILVYRQGIPRAIYNGPYNVTAISEYALVEACNDNYIETVNLSRGVQVEGNYGIPGRTESLGASGLTPENVTTAAPSTQFSESSLRGETPETQLVNETPIGQ